MFEAPNSQGTGHALHFYSYASLRCDNNQHLALAWQLHNKINSQVVQALSN